MDWLALALSIGWPICYAAGWYCGRWRLAVTSQRLVDLYHRTHGEQKRRAWRSICRFAESTHHAKTCGQNVVGPNHPGHCTCGRDQALDAIAELRVIHAEG